jgi:hypothetical protein
MLPYDEKSRDGQSRKILGSDLRSVEEQSHAPGKS